MTEQKKQNGFKIFNTLCFLIMITVNALANILPINGVQTGQVSDSYTNLFTPAGVTFAIWGVIYLLLALFILYQLGGLKNYGVPYSDTGIQNISIPFGLSCLANASWIFAWHYNHILLSLALMAALALLLGWVYVSVQKAAFPLHKKLLVRLPFSVYFGWITIATIANVAVFLVSQNWDGWGISQPTWTVLILVVGMAIAAVIILKNRDIAYGLVILWAYTGILIKHVSSNGFGGAYPQVIMAAGICMAAIVLAIFLVVSKQAGQVKR